MKTFLAVLVMVAACSYMADSRLFAVSPASPKITTVKAVEPLKLKVTNITAHSAMANTTAAHNATGAEAATKIKTAAVSGPKPVVGTAKPKVTEPMKPKLVTPGMKMIGTLSNATSTSTNTTKSG